VYKRIKKLNRYVMRKTRGRNMKKFDRVFIACIAIFIIAIIGINVFIKNKDFGDGSKEYKVSLNRVEQALKSYEEREGKAPEGLETLCKIEGIDVGESILGLEIVALNNSNQLKNLVTQDSHDYHLVITDNYIYKINYAPDTDASKIIFLYVNVIAGILLIGVIFVYIYIRVNIIKPFNSMSTMPYELAKGNLNMPLTENKNKFFGKFVWGMDLLRENLEENKTKELELQKERKMLLLSLSHDIKTPLSAIKLYSKALSKNLYKTEEKRDEILINISDKVDEIEAYISEIVKASKEDFLHFEVNNGEFYMKDVMEAIREYYQEKMQLNQIDFTLSEYRNSMVYGDKDRLIEVIQNVIENAIKYGDGKKIWLDMSKDEESYTIKVFNTGCKLSERELPHIFDSFFRGTNVDKQQGSGLGLYICRSLMHLMEGGITAELLDKDDKNTLESSGMNGKQVSASDTTGLMDGLEKSVICIEITVKLA